MPEQGLDGAAEQVDRELGGVHADEQGRQGRVGAVERGGQPHVHRSLDLRLDGEALRGVAAVEHQDPAADPDRPDDVEGVEQGGLGDRGGALGRQGRAQAGLDPTGDRLLGEHEHLHLDLGLRVALHEPSRRTRDMSRTAFRVPPTVPVTFDRPVRGR